MNTIAEHIVSGYDDELNTLKITLAELGELVETMVADSMTSVHKRDSALARSVIERDQQANLLQEKADEDAMRILALRHPMAADLRRVMGAIRVASDLERIGDLAEGIARRALTINETEALSLAKGVYRMGKLVKSQLEDVLNALRSDDVIKAKQVWLADNDVDEMYNSLFRELLTYMMEDPRTISSSTGLLFAAKNLERIGDHATNISEAVHFIVEGIPLTPELAKEALEH